LLNQAQKHYLVNDDVTYIFNDDDEDEKISRRK